MKLGLQPTDPRVSNILNTNALRGFESKRQCTFLLFVLRLMPLFIRGLHLEESICCCLLGAGSKCPELFCCKLLSIGHYYGAFRLNQFLPNEL